MFSTSGSGGIDGIENYRTIDALLAQRPDTKVVSLCRPPVAQFAAARATPIAADLTFTDGTGLDVSAGFDWHQWDDDIWQIEVETDQGKLRLTDGGARLFTDGTEQAPNGEGECPGIYRQMADLLDRGASDVDVIQLVHVSDAYMPGHHVTVAPFHD